MRVDSCPPLTLPKGKVSKLDMDVIFGGCAKMKNVDHINRTLNQFELHQYFISLLRKTQNTFLEPAVKIFG